MDGKLIWFVAFFLYIYDSISFRERGAVLRYSLDGVTAMLTIPSFTISRYRIFVPNPLRPDHCDLVLTQQSEVELSRVDKYLIDRASKMYLAHQLVAVGALVILFGLTPVLATRMNLRYACLITVGMTFWISGFHWIAMWKNRFLLGTDVKALRSDILHVFLCPPHAANSARRIAALRHPRYGVLTCLRAFSSYDTEKYNEQFQSNRASA